MMRSSALPANPEAGEGRTTGPSTQSDGDAAPAQAAPAPFARWFAGLSTSVKLILTMLVFLAPLGIIAILAAIESARSNHTYRMVAGRAQAVESARAIDALLNRTIFALHAAGGTGNATDPARCRRTLADLAGAYRPAVELGLFTASGRRICATSPFDLRAPLPAGRLFALTIDGSALHVATVAGPELVGRARISQAALEAVGRPVGTGEGHRLLLRRGAATMTLINRATPRSVEAPSFEAPIADGQARIALSLPAERLTPTEALGILLPIMMLVAAGIVAFLVSDRLMLRPLRQLQTAVLAYRAGDSGLAMPQLTSPAHEIGALASAFCNVTQTVARHEAEMEEGLARQTRLTREVHHRVKNNLQVVASLINLHARGAGNPEVAGAYAAIQRRVDALAVVHRNHYAEVEDNRGVALRSLIGELAANLRAGAPVEAAAMPIMLDLAPLYATQDVAVPVAFIVTELVETAMLREPGAAVSISLKPAGLGRSTLTVAGAAFRSSAAVGEQRSAERCERVLQGLSRQLRSALVRDDALGCVAIEIAVV